MAYSTSLGTNQSIGVVFGTLALKPGSPFVGAMDAASPLADVLVEAKFGALGAPPDQTAYFAETRTDDDGNWAISTAGLQAGQHLVEVNVEFGPIIASRPVTIAAGAYGKGKP